jgi:hypothetical protein
LPFFPSMSQQEVEYVCNTFTQILNEELGSSSFAAAPNSRALVAASGVPE